MTRTALAAATACAIALLPTSAAQAGDDMSGTTFHVSLFGSQVPGGGDPDGTGTAVLKVNPAENELCWDISWDKLDGDLTGIHVHSGHVGETGEHAVDLLVNASLPGPSGTADGCTTPSDDHDEAGGHHMAGGHMLFNAHEVPDGGGSVLEQIVADPDHYYINVHTTAYEMGAIRGQLG